MAAEVVLPKTAVCANGEVLNVTPLEYVIYTADSLCMPMQARLTCQVLT